MVRCDRISEDGQNMRLLNGFQFLDVFFGSVKEGRPMDVGRLIVPVELQRLRDFELIPFCCAC